MLFPTVDLMMELQETLGPDEGEFNAVSAFGKFCCHFVQWTRPATFIQKIMNSTVMCLLPEQTGEVDKG